MPVRFKGKSEYDSHFKWVESYRSKGFKPTTEQAAPEAGVESYQMSSNMIEPPLQHKMRVNGPTPSMSCDFFDKPSRPEYIVLGGQDKFTSNNVIYIPKKRLNMDNVNRSDANSRFIQPSPNEPIKNFNNYIKEVTSTKEEKPVKVTKAPKVNTKKFTDLQTPVAPREVRHPMEVAPREVRHPMENKQVQTNNIPENQTQTKVKSSDVRKSQSEPILQKKKQEGNQKQIPHKPKPKVGNKREIEFVDKAALKDKNLNEVLGMEKPATKDKVNEFIQTNARKGIYHSGPEASSDYALQYKAGVAPIRKGKKWSEYQLEFDWKNRVSDSPLIAADQIVHKSNAALVAPKTSVKPRGSEYKSQFKSWKHKPVGRKVTEEEPDLKIAKIKRSKSMGAVDRKKTTETKIVNKDKIEAADVIKASHGKLRRKESEYDANFKAPSNYEYKNGAWQGANPPHLYTSSKKNTDKNKEPAEKLDSNWFQEVQELRQKAEEYRKRGQGSHFSRSHLAQLFAKQTELWDCDTYSESGRTSTISALSLETGSLPAHKPARLELKERTLRKKGQVEEYKERIINDMDSTKATIAESPVTSDYGDPEVRNYKPSYAAGRPAGRPSRPRQVKQAWRYNEPKSDTNHNSHLVENERDDHVSVEEDNSSQYMEGRLPTPQFQKLHRPASRHHFDLTTPSVGGALLSSPPHVHKQRPMKKYVSNKETSTIQSYNHHDMSDDEEDRMIGKTYNLIKMTPKPTYGQPTRDTHYLLDDEASTDRPMQSQFMETQVYEDSEGSTIEEEQSVQATQPKYLPEPRIKKRVPQAPAMEAINENFGQTYNKPVVPPLYSYNDVEDYYYDDDNDDALSISVRSVASSCSLASQILERTRDRQNFWNSTQVKTK